MDISNAILAKSDQLNASDLIGAAQTVTITETREGTDEQRVVITTDVFGKARPFKPSKTVLRMLGAAWGKETNEWVGHSMTLYCDPSVRWAGEEVGGIRIKALSHIDKPMTFNLPTSKTKHAKSIVTPLATPAARDWLTELTDAGDDIDLIRALGNAANAAHAGAAIIGAIRTTFDAAKSAKEPENA